jgi:hypothetical protein
MTSREESRTERDNADIRNTVEQLTVAVDALPPATLQHFAESRTVSLIRRGTVQIRYRCRNSLAASLPPPAVPSRLTRG